MKRLFYILLMGGLFVSCASDEVEPILSDRIASLEISSVGGYGTQASDQTYTLEYDAAGRLRKLNDKVFYYGIDGKVAYSRVFIETPHSYGKMVYIERLAYHWDAQGRLKEVYLDSLYKKTPAIPGGMVVENSESLIKGVLLASYTYEEKSRKPMDVIYRPLTRSGTNIIDIKAEEKISYTYEGDNPTSSVRTGVMTTPTLPVPHAGTPYRLTTTNTYLSNIHPLSKIYNQLGFHPTAFTEVIPLNCLSTRQQKIVVEADGNGEFVGPEGENIKWTDYGQGEVSIGTGVDFSGKTTYSYRFNALGLPTEIVAEGAGVMQRTLITYE